MTEQKVACAKCGKTKADMDFADDGQLCRSPVIMSPAVGDWFCRDNAKSEKHPQTAQFANEPPM